MRDIRRPGADRRGRDHESRAVVVYACDEVRTGDFLASFDPESARDRSRRQGRLQRARRILFADEGQMLGSPRRLMVIERGKEQGAFVGERVILFRQRGRATSTAQRVIVGSAVIVAVRAGSATIRIERVTDAISAGDGRRRSSTRHARSRAVVVPELMNKHRPVGLRSQPSYCPFL